MPKSWKEALTTYSYPVDMKCYEKAREFPGFFCTVIKGDRNSTMAFEDHYQKLAPTEIAAFFEVVFWKLYSQRNRCQKGTTRIVDFVQETVITPERLWEAVQLFVRTQTRENLKRIRGALGIRTDVLAVPLTLPALASLETIPMIDNQVARWVTHNYIDHNTNRVATLAPFEMNYTSLRDNDFSSYLRWVHWCREVAQVLTNLTAQRWRARDIEMAVFTAQRNGMALNVLP